MTEGMAAPDGEGFVYATDGFGPWHLWMASLGTGRPYPLKTEPGYPDELAWSRDGKRLAYVRDDSVVVMHLDSLQSRVVWSAGPRVYVSALRWTVDDVIVFERRRQFEIRPGTWGTEQEGERLVLSAGCAVPAPAPRDTTFSELAAYSPDGRTISRGGRTGAGEASTTNGSRWRHPSRAVPRSRRSEPAEADHFRTSAPPHFRTSPQAGRHRDA